MTELVLVDAESAHRRRRITAADHRECLGEPGHCLRDPSCPAAKISSSNTPIGPFQKTVWASASRAANSSTETGPMSSPSSCRGSDQPRRPWTQRPRRPIARSRRRPAGRPCRTRGTPCTCRPGRSRATTPTGCTGAAKNVKHMPPPTSSRSTLGSRFSITASLSETFEPPRTTTYGRFGLLSQLGEHLDLAQDKIARARATAVRARQHLRARDGQLRTRHRRRHRQASRALPRTHRVSRRPWTSPPGETERSQGVRRGRRPGTADTSFANSTSSPSSSPSRSATGASEYFGLRPLRPAECARITTRAPRRAAASAWEGSPGSGRHR